MNKLAEQERRIQGVIERITKEDQLKQALRDAGERIYNQELRQYRDDTAQLYTALSAVMTELEVRGIAKEIVDTMDLDIISTIAKL